MSVITGKDGTLRLGGVELAPLTSWRLVRTSRNRDYAANDTGGARRRVAGIRDCRGSFALAATAAGNLPVAEGTAVELELHADGSGANYLAVPAIVDRIEVEVDIDRGEIVAFLVDFSGNGPVTPHGLFAVGS